MARAIDWTQVDALKAQGLAERAIARELVIPWGTFWEKQKHEAQHTEKHSGTPAADHAQDTRATRVYQRDGSGTPQHTRVHSGTPVEQPTQAHPGVPMPDEIAVRLPSLPASAIANGC
jgi:hypothetical protein